MVSHRRLPCRFIGIRDFGNGGLGIGGERTEREFTVAELSGLGYSLTRRDTMQCLTSVFYEVAG